MKRNTHSIRGVEGSKVAINYLNLTEWWIFRNAKAQLSIIYLSKGLVVTNKLLRQNEIPMFQMQE